MSATSDVRQALRATSRFLALSLLALAGTATAQTPPYFINAFGTPPPTTVHEGQTITPVVRVTDGSGTPVEGWTVDWTVGPSGSIAPTSTTSTSSMFVLGGVASNSFTNYVAGTYTINASTFDGMVIILKDGTRVTPQGTAGPVSFTVNVENVGMLHMDPSTGADTVLTNVARQLQVYWGSASLPKAGTTLQWSIVSQPVPGAGSVTPTSVTDASGLGSVSFSGTVAGVYTVRAAEFGCTWCGPTSRDFTITVVDPTADVHAILSDAPDPVDPGATITYTIGVGNNGPDAAANASFSIATPTDTVFESMTSVAGWSCSTPAAGGTGTITCSQASLASGAADLFDLVVRVGNPTAGTIINASVSITTATAETSSVNNDASTDTTVNALYAWTFDKVLTGSIDNDSSTSVTVGDQLDYGITVTNTGNAPLTNVVINDDVIGGPSTCASLAVAAQCALNGGYLVTAADEQAGQVVNTASATSDQIPGPATDTVTTPVVLIPAPALDLVKLLAGYDDVDGSGDVTEGDTLHYEITATNTGNVPLTSLLLSDDHFANTQTCASVPVAGTCVLTGDYLVTGADRVATQIVNTASALPSEFSVPTTTQLTTLVAFHPAPSMTVAKARTSTTDNDGSGTVTEGDLIHYTVTATNTGNVTLLNLQIDDAQMTPSFEVCSGVSPGGSCLLNGTHTVTRNDALAGQVVNTASAFSTELPTPLSSNTVTTTVAGTPGQAIDKVLTGTFDFDGSGDVSLGDELYYDVTVTNTGTTELHNVVVSDDHYGGTQACAQMFAGNTCVLNVIYTVQMADALAGQVVNIGSAVSDQFPSGMSDTVTTVVSAPPPALNIVSGDGSAGYGGQSAQLVVSLFDAGGNPMVGATITWSGAANGTTTVQADGTSTNTVNFNGTTGFSTVTAAYLPASLEVQFTVQSVSASLSVVSGNNQDGAAGSDLAQPLVVLAADDGSPAGAPIHWTVLSGDASVSPEFTSADVDGLATTTVTLGPGLGPVQIQAQRTDAGETAVFMANALAPGLVLVSGNNQSAPAGQFLPLFLTVESQLGGAPQSNVDILWTTTATGAGFTQMNNPTDANGIGNAQIQCGPTAESFTVTAARVDIPSVSVTFNASCTLVRTLVIHDGNFQFGSPGATLPLNLVVEAQDNGVGVDGVVINYTVIGGSDAIVGTCCATTAGGGFAGSSLTLRTTPGPVQVRAERADDPTVFVVFDATAQTRGLNYVSGDNQSAPTGVALTDNLTVLSTLDGSPEGNITIDWTSTAAAASLTIVDNPTDANGLGTAQVTCGATAETFIVTAARFDDPSLQVNFTATCTLTRTLVITAGNNQSGAPGALLPIQLQVQAQDNGAGADGVGITFSVVGSDAQVGTPNATTAGGGFAGSALTLRTTSGPVVVRAARTDDPTVFVDFDATALARGLVVVSGNSQSAPTGTALADLLVVQSQLAGAAEANVAIDWSSTSAGATLVPVTNPTDAGGNGSAQVTCGPTAETFNVVATRVDDPSLGVSFAVSCTLTRTLVIASGNNQAGRVGTFVPQDLVVEARNNGVGADGVGINFTVIGGSDASLGSGTATTAGGGFAGTSLQLRSTPGTVQVRAERADDPAVFVVFTATAAQPTLTLVSGNPQSGNPGGPGAAPLVVEMRDGTPANNPVANQTIFWATGSGDAQPDAPTSLTGPDGRATMTFTYGAAGDSLITADDGNLAPVGFNVHAVSRTLTAISSDGATFTVGETPFYALQVQSLVDGVPETTGDVTWAVTTGNASIAGTSPIEAGGFAYNMIEEVNAAGPLVITATHPLDPSATATFSFTVVDLPTLSIVSGDNQSGLVGTDADAPLVLVIRDASGNPVPGKVVNWSINAGGGSVSSPTTVTDANGLAQVTLDYGPTPGPITILADSPGLFPITFQAEALAPGIGIGSGNNQSAPVNTTLPLPLTVVVGEVVITALKGRVGAAALDGVPVTFAVTSGGGSVNPTTVLTDANGNASTQFTLGPIEGTQTVTASVAGGASVTFTATATVARTLTLVSGDGQAAAPGSALAAPLVVHAQDNGVDAGGVVINWSLVSGSAPATITPSGATTAAGLADATVTLGATPGPVSIRAERADDPTVFVVFEANTAKIQDIPGLTPEERELAIVIDDTCAALAGMASLTPQQQDFLARCQELTDGSIIDPGAVTDALEQLLPGVALAMQEAAFNAAQAQFQNLKARIAALRSGTQGSSFQGLALNNSSGTVSLGSLGAALTEDEPAKTSGEAGTDFQRWGFFASGTIGRGEAEAGSTRPAYDYDINGLTVGIDYRKSDTFIFGAALGYTRQDSELRGAPGNMDMSGWSVSGYATWYRDNSWYTDAVLTYGHNNFDLLRTISYTVPLPGGGSSTVDQTARSNSDGSLLEGAFTFGRDFQAGGWSIGPYGRVLYTKLDFDRIVDEMDSGPGSGLGLEIDSRSLTSLASEIGAKFTYAHSTDWGVVTPHIQLEWEHEFKDDPRALTARFLADPNSTPFTLSGEEIDTDFFRVSVGLSIIMQRGRSGFLIYERTVGREGFFQDNLGFGVRIEF